MVDFLRWISFRGKEIMYCDLRNLDAEKLIIVLNKSIKAIPELGKNDLLLLFDVSNTFFNRETFSVAIELAKVIKPYRLKSAFVGVTGGKKFLLNTILSVTKTGNVVKPFDNIEEAQKWLIS